MGTLCRAWAVFDGETMNIHNQFNVSSITDINNGRYRVNFTNNMPSNKYAVACDGKEFSGNNATATTYFLNEGTISDVMQTGSVQIASKVGDRYDASVLVTVAVFS